MITIARTGWATGTPRQGLYPWAGHGCPRGCTCIWYLCFLLFVGYGLAGTGVARAEEGSVDDGLSVMQAFTELEEIESDLVKIDDEKKRLVLFAMGIFLLLGVITTASLGVAMVLFGKQVFIAHMIFAGLSVFLAVVHAITAMVWFFPF